MTAEEGFRRVWSVISQLWQMTSCMRKPTVRRIYSCAVGSLLRRGVADTGISAAIEIPFPQRDFHLRPVDADVAERLSGREPKKNENVPEFRGTGN
jgi:hypothetical protein